MLLVLSNLARPYGPVKSRAPGGVQLLASDILNLYFAVLILSQGGNMLGRFATRAESPICQRMTLKKGSAGNWRWCEQANRKALS
jgi:hypothetical protein